MKKLDLFWKSNRDWWEYNENHVPVLKPEAPVEAKVSFERYCEQVESSAL